MLQFTFLENGTIASHAIGKKAIFPRGEKHLYRIELPGRSLVGAKPGSFFLSNDVVDNMAVDIR